MTSVSVLKKDSIVEDELKKASRDDSTTECGSTDYTNTENSSDSDSDSEYDSDESSYMEDINLSDDEESVISSSSDEDEDITPLKSTKKASDLTDLMKYLQVNKKLGASTRNLTQIKAATANHATLSRSVSMPAFSGMVNKPASAAKTERLSHLLFSEVNIPGLDMQPVPAKSLENFFFIPSDEHRRAYTKEVRNAVTTQNMDQLRELKEQGQLFDCCNQVGEGLVHTACRQGLTKSIEFLLNEGNTCLRRVDDFGRTPLHDAFWAAKPQFEIVKMIMKREPDLMFISDTKGFLPLDYAPQSHKEAWSEFLKENTDILRPRDLCARTA